MDIDRLTSYRELARKLARDIDDLVERRRATLALLELKGSDTSKARHVLNVSEELQRKILERQKIQVERDFQELLKSQDRG